MVSDPHFREESSAGGGLSSNLFMEGLADFIQTSLSCDKRSLAVKGDQCSAFDDQICNSQEQIREPSKHLFLENFAYMLFFWTNFLI